MNGYGHFAAGVVLVRTSTGRVRGDAAGDRRARSGCAARAPALARALRPGAARACAARRGALLAACAVAFVAVGGWIFYNTNIAQRVPAGRRRAATGRRTTRRSIASTSDLPQPRIVAVYADVDIYPERAPRRDPRALPARATSTPRRSRDLHVTHAIRARSCASLRSPTATAASSTTARLGYRIYRLDEPLAPGATMELRVRRSSAPSAASPTTACRRRAAPATCARAQLQRHVLQQHRLCSRTSATTTAAQLVDRNERRKRGLGDVPRTAKLEDEAARGSIGFAGRRLDRLRDHGQHQRRPDRARAGLPAARVDRGRPPLLPLQDGPADAGVLLLPVGALGRCKRGEWHGVPIEVYYDPKHPYNVDRMIDAREEVARLLHGALRALPAPPGAHPRVPALRALRAELRQHDSVLRSRSASSPTCAIPTTSTTCSTSPRTRSRTSGGRTR